MPDSQTKDVCIDALCLDFRGWTEDLAQSGLSAIHVTSSVAWEFTQGFMGFTSAIEAIVHETTEHRKRIQESDAQMFALDSKDALDQLGTNGKVGVIFGLQDLSGVEFHPNLGEVLLNLGIRVVQPTYNYANLYGDGCMESRNAGLTQAGRNMVKAFNEVGISLDVSHVGEQTALEIIELSTVPVSATHANRRAIYDNQRNKSDAVLRAVADSGGVVGVGTIGALLWDGNPDPGSFPTMQNVIDHILHLVDFLGEDHVGIGSDHMVSPDPDNDPVPGWWRGGAPLRAHMRKPPPLVEFAQAYFPSMMPTIALNYPREFDTVAGWATIPQRLRDAGLPEAAVTKVLGGNWIRYFRETW